MRRDGEARLLRSLTIWRTMRIPMYAGLVISGVVSGLAPSEAMDRFAPEAFIITLAVSMVFSSLICLYGAITDKWIGEFTGLPLLASVLAIYGITAVACNSSGEIIVLVYGLSMISFAFGLCARWNEVRRIKQSAVLVGTQRKE